MPTACRGRGSHVERRQVSTATSTAMVHPARLVGAPRPIPGHRRSSRPLAPEGQPVGNPAPDHYWPPHRAERSVILGYVEDGPNLVTMAMNGWADGEPAWWLNLQAHPDATVLV